MDSENPTDHVFVDIDAEGQSDLLGNPLAAPGAVAPFARPGPDASAGCTNRDYAI